MPSTKSTVGNVRVIGFCEKKSDLSARSLIWSSFRVNVISIFNYHNIHCNCCRKMEKANHTNIDEDNHHRLSRSSFHTYTKTHHARRHAHSRRINLFHMNSNLELCNHHRHIHPSMQIRYTKNIVCGHVPLLSVRPRPLQTFVDGLQQIQVQRSGSPMASMRGYSGLRSFVVAWWTRWQGVKFFFLKTCCWIMMSVLLKEEKTATDRNMFITFSTNLEEKIRLHIIFLTMVKNDNGTKV